MSTEKHIESIALHTNGLPGTISGDAAREAMAHLLDSWNQARAGKTPPGLVNMVGDITQLVEHLTKMQLAVQTKLSAANAAYLDAAAYGKVEDLESARFEGADIASLSEQALQLAAQRKDDDYLIARKLLEHTYGEQHLPTFDGMSALCHSLPECIEQVKLLAKNAVAVERGIELPDMFKF